MRSSKRRSAKEATSFRLMPDTLKRLKGLAQSTGMSQGTIIDLAVGEYAARNGEVHHEQVVYRTRFGQGR
jgi:predicted DNA-binding protein